MLKLFPMGALALLLFFAAPAIGQQVITDASVGGRVTEAQKAGRVQGTSRLGVQLTDLTLVDGDQVPIQSQLISRGGPTSVGRDAAAIILFVVSRQYAFLMRLTKRDRV